MKLMTLLRTAVPLLALAGGAVALLYYSPAAGLRGATTATEPAPAPPAADVLLLYDSRSPQPSDYGFRKVTDFYGLSRDEVDLSQTRVSGVSLADRNGSRYRAVYIAGTTLDYDVDLDDLAVLQSAIREGGVKLLVSGIAGRGNSAIPALTDGRVQGSTRLPAGSKQHQVSSAWPEVTRELSGIAVVHAKDEVDYGLDVEGEGAEVQVLAASGNGSGQTYPLFLRYRAGAGQVFLSSEMQDKALADLPLWEVYYAEKQPSGAFKMNRFAQLMPMMMFVRFAAGDRAWHSTHRYANLTIDDPPLRSSSLDYDGILREAIARNFHITIATVPAEYTQAEARVTELFLNHPSRLSLVQHGNNHDDYEFYKYTAPAGDAHKPRSLEEQEANIVEGRTRMEALRRQTGVPYGPIMVFPFNISPAPTLSILKQYNFQATLNSVDNPLDEPLTQEPLAHMYPAEMSYRGFASIYRTTPGQVPYPFHLFIDRPVFLYEHKEFFAPGSASFNAFADAINRTPGPKIEWQSLDYILKRMYLEKTNIDGSNDVMFFGNEVIITNETEARQVFHLRRRVTAEVPVASVTVDSQPAPYRLAGDELQLDLTIPASASRQVRIKYRPASRDFAVDPAEVSFDVGTGTIAATIRNPGKEAGPVPVGFYEGPSVEKGKLLALTMVRRLEPGGSAVVTATVNLGQNTALTVAVDPYDVIPETNETNNSVTFAPGRR